MPRPAAVVAVLLGSSLLIGAGVAGVADNGGGGFPGPVELGGNRGVSPTDRTTDEFLAATASCGPLPDDHFAAVAGDGEPELRLEPVVDLPLATTMTFLPDGSALVGQQDGRIWRLVEGRLSEAPVVDLSSDTSTDADQGLLGLAIDPGADWLYVNRTDAGGDSVVLAFPLAGGVPDATRPTTVLVVDQPTRQHNGGTLAFGPDGYLYVTFGDGGGLGDPYHNSQDPGTVLGSIVRLEPRPEEIPPAVPAPGNPFAEGDRDAAWSWAFGTRNPYRFSFDRQTGDLWVGDLGQQCVEEIDVLTPADAGANLGWSVLEGTRPFLGTEDDLADHHPPTFEYRHDVGLCAVVGGYVYRGSAIPELTGRYVFSDFCSGELFVLDPADPSTPVRWPGSRIRRPVSFAEDPEGELWVTSIEEGVLRLVAG